MLPGVSRAIQSPRCHCQSSSSCFWYFNRCQAVAHVHANGVVHSDVKPDNVLIDASGRPRLGDFDVSKDATVRRTHRFASTRAAGTFGYLAPEVINGGGATEAMRNAPCPRSARVDCQASSARCTSGRAR